jgi:hypothetical protein
MKPKIDILDFKFSFSGYGHYKVIYKSPVTLKSWSIITNNIHLIDATKNADEPLISNLNKLKSLCKSGTRIK